MGKINPKLREQLEALPIDVKNQILELGQAIETKQDLERCLALIEHRERCCGDL